jgi:type II secretory pathway pseudopilin PulG
MSKPSPLRDRKPSEDGYMLLAVIFMLVLVLLSLSVAAPQIAKSIQRDREMETMQRGKQYIRAIQLYYRKFQAYPPNMDALVKTNNIRFLRKKYVDPLTGKPDWKPILFGQNKAPLAMGFFGQPLGGMGGAMPVAGIGPGGGNTQPGNGLGTPGGSSFGGSSMGGSSFGGSSMGGSSFGGSSMGGGMGSSTGGSLFGSTNSGTAPTAGGSPATGAGTNTGGATGSTGASGSTGDTGSSGSGTGFMSGQNGQTFGGGGIIGVEPVLNKPSILIYKKKTRYNQWEFTYSPLQDMMKQMGAGGIAAPPGGGTAQPGSPGFGSPGGLGGSTGGFGGTSFGGAGGSTFGGAGGSTFGGSSPSPSQPTQPQQ